MHGSSETSSPHRAWTETEYTFLKRQSERNSGTWVAIDDGRNVAVGSVN